MTQTEAVQQWWAGLTTVERDAVLRLPPASGLPQGFTLDLAESGVAVERFTSRRWHEPTFNAFPDVLVQHLARVRGGDGTRLA